MILAKIKDLKAISKFLCSIIKMQINTSSFCEISGSRLAFYCLRSKTGRRSELQVGPKLRVLE